MTNAPDPNKAPTPLALAPMAPLTPLAPPAPMSMPPALHVADASLASAPHLVAPEAAHPLHALAAMGPPVEAPRAPPPRTYAPVPAPPHAASAPPAPAPHATHARPLSPPPPTRPPPRSPPPPPASRGTPRTPVAPRVRPTPSLHRPATTTAHVGTPPPIPPPPAPAPAHDATPSWPKGLVLEPEAPAQRPGTQPMPGPHGPHHPPRPRPGARPKSDGSKGGVGWLIGLGLVTLMLRNCEGCKDDEPRARRPGPSRPDSAPTRVDRPLNSTELRRLHQLRRAHEEGEALTAAERRELLELERRARAR